MVLTAPGGPSGTIADGKEDEQTGVETRTESSMSRKEKKWESELFFLRDKSGCF